MQHSGISTPVLDFHGFIRYLRQVIIPTRAMTTAQPFVLQSAPVVGVAPIVRTPEQQQQHAQAKAQKKARKHERLRDFFAWCAGCRYMGGSF